MLTELEATLSRMLDAAELLAELVVEGVALEEVELVVRAELVAFATVLVARDCDVLNVAAWAACLVVDAACVATYIRTSRVLTCQPCNHSPLGRRYHVPTWKQQQQRQRSDSRLPLYYSAVGDCTRLSWHRNACPRGIAPRRHFSSGMGSSVQVKGVASSRCECSKT